MRAVPRKRLTTILLVLLALGLMVGHVEASDGMRGDRCVVAEDDYIVEDFYFLCRVLEVRGTIEGDLIGAASNVSIERTGVVTGDIWVLGGRVVIAGTVGDDVHFAGASLSISDRASFTDERIDVAAVALNVEITQEASIPGDLLFYGYQAIIRGLVGGDVDFGGEALVIDGRVLGRVDAAVGDARRSSEISGLPIYDISFSNPGLRIGEDAFIGGDLVYESASRSWIPPGIVQGRTRYEQILTQPDITKAEQAEVAAEILQDYILASIRDVLILVLIGLVALGVAPALVREPARHVGRRPIPTVGWGLIAFMLLVPAAIMLILLSLLVLFLLIRLGALSLLLSVVLLAVNLSLVGGFYALLFFLGRVVIGFTLGQLVWHFLPHVPEPDTLRQRIIILLIGGVVYTLITNVPIPWLGLSIELTTALSGVGAIVLYVREVFYSSRAVRPHPVLASPASIPSIPMTAPPPPPEDFEMSPGMDNLPEGFTGFDDD